MIQCERDYSSYYTLAGKTRLLEPYVRVPGIEVFGESQGLEHALYQFVIVQTGWRDRDSCLEEG
jgi:hypothetical protein